MIIIMKVTPSKETETLDDSKGKWKSIYDISPIAYDAIIS